MKIFTRSTKYGGIKLTLAQFLVSNWFCVVFAISYFSSNRPAIFVTHSRIEQRWEDVIAGWVRESKEDTTSRKSRGRRERLDNTLRERHARED